MRKKSPQKTLGRTSAKLIQMLLREGKQIFVIEDAVNIIGKDKQSVTRFINELVKRNVVARINAGTYLILETGHETTQLTNWPVIANAVAGTHEYYISHYAAMRLHGMTTHALKHIKITITKRRRKKIINSIHYEFVYCKPENFWGVELYWATKNLRVNVSNLERTIIDALLKSEYCGGISEVASGIWLKQNEINWKILLDYLQKSPSKSVIKRLGYLLDRLNIGAEYLNQIQQMIVDSNDYVLLEAKGLRKGKHIKLWRLIVNEEISKR